MHLKPDSRPVERPLADASGEVSPAELFHLIASGAYDAELRLIAEQAQMLTLASGAAIALRQGDLMVCRARAGATAPDLGAQLDTQSGLSGECVREARILVCGDTENDARVNLDVCRYLGIRSIAVLPICLGEQVAGVFEVFSAQPGAFAVNEVAALESMRDLVISVIRPAPTHRENPAAAALAERAAQEQPAFFLDPEDDLLCEIEQRARPAAQDDAGTRAFELVKGRGAQPAPAPVPPAGPPPAPTPSSVAPSMQPRRVPAWDAAMPSAPEPSPRLIVPPPAPEAPSAPVRGVPEPPPRFSSPARAPAPGAPVTLASVPSAPAVSLPAVPPLSSLPAAAGFPAFANADPEDDLVCEIEMRHPGQSVLHPNALSGFAPAPHRPPEQVISRKLIVAGVVVALVGLMWLRWCNHGQPAAKNPSSGATVQAASNTAPPVPEAAPPAPTVPDNTAPVAPPVAAPQAAESLPQSDASAPLPSNLPESTGTPEAEPSPQRPSHRAAVPVHHKNIRHENSAARGSTRSRETAKAAPQPSAASPPASSGHEAMRPSLAASPPSTVQQQAKSNPPALLQATPPAQPASPPSSPQPAPVAATTGAPHPLSLSQAVVSEAAESPSGGSISRDALRLLRDSASAGDASAQLALAVRYANGEGVKQSYPESLKWFSQARAQGVTPRQGKAQEAWTRVQQWAQSHPGKR